MQFNGPQRLQHRRRRRGRIVWAITRQSVWIAANGQTEYMFDVTIQDGRLIVHDATPSRAGDPALQMVRDVPRNTLTRDAAFNAGIAELFKYSQQQNWWFYSIIRDQTGPTSKQRYKELRSLVESHFYILLRSDPGQMALSSGALSAPGIGGPYEPVRSR